MMHLCSCSSDLSRKKQVWLDRTAYASAFGGETNSANENLGTAHTEHIDLLIRDFELA